MLFIIIIINYYVVIVFQANGTAHTQYNFEPYYNSKKPIIMPNYSFDLCRLSCSLFDFICDDIRNIDEFRNEVPIYDLIFSWIYDDNNRNVLYKSNGEDKYPGFKLYKMISKLYIIIFQKSNFLIKFSINIL